MSETRKDASDRALLKTLGEWPEPAISAEDWEARASEVDAKVANSPTKAHIGTENFLDPPLPSTPEEGHKTAASTGVGVAPSSRSASVGQSLEGKMASSTTTSTRERRSFQDLARMANTPPPPSVRSQPVSSPPSGILRAAEAHASDSGVVDLKAAAASDPMASSRAQSTPLASQPLFDEEDRNSQPPSSLRNSQAPMSAPAISSAVASAVLSGQPVSGKVAKGDKNDKKKSSGLLLIGGVAAIAAMAAGAFFVVKAQQAKRAAQAVAMIVPAPADPNAEAAPLATTAPAAAPVALATATPADDTSKTDDPTKGAVGGGGKVATAPNAAPKKAGGARVAKADPTDKTDKIDPKLVAKDLPPAPGPTGALADAIKQSAAVTPAPTPASQDTTPAAPAATDPAIAAGSVPQKPSQGAVTGAIGAALPAARACLKQDEPVSRAAVTFGSNGSVQSVIVTGNAAGKPAEGCIKAALGKAKVPAFAMPTYSANVTVRPAN